MFLIFVLWNLLFARHAANICRATKLSLAFLEGQNCLQTLVARQNVCWTQLSLFVQKKFNALAGPAPYTYSEACLTVCSTRRFNLIPPEFYFCLLSEFFSPHFAVYIKNQLWGHQQIPISWWVVAGRYLFHIVILFNQRVPPTFQSKISKKLFQFDFPPPPRPSTDTTPAPVI
jgi:hypothetical protein